MTRVYLALGSNLGDRLANLRAAIASLDERGIAVTARSSAWETPPVPAGQPPFLNAAVAAETALDPRRSCASSRQSSTPSAGAPARTGAPAPSTSISSSTVMCASRRRS
ncbi:MAG: 2-amino-4-hydroxy-6-hydroxymethyldihydropteridine diphosphokinase [Dehalococcoidia bacterium]|nr:2-amino-4-hydroxy-6-hydroxymethyldihydropteridine diphosphokinase [Dehalococcoidia bacterium]